VALYLTAGPGEVAEVTSIEVVSAVDSGSWVCVTVQKPLVYLSRGQEVKLTQGESGRALFVQSLMGAQCLVSTTRKLAAPRRADSELTVFQLLDGEEVQDLANRCGGSEVVAPTGKDGDLEHFRALLRPGDCVVRGPGEPPNAWLDGLVRYARKTSPSIVGCCGDPSGANARLITYNAHSDDTNWHVELKQGWFLGPIPVGSRHYPLGSVHAVTAGLRIQDPWRALQHLLDGEDTVVDLGNDHPAPKWPGTVRVDGEDYLAIEVRHSFDFAAGEAQFNRRATLVLTDRPHVALQTANGEEVFVLAARINGWVEGGTPKNMVMGVAPAQFPESPFLPWQVGGGERELRVLQLTSGFVRSQHSAYYAKFSEGDLVLLRVAFGQPPIIIGALQNRRDHIEGAEGVDVVISGRNVRVDTWDNDERRAPSSLRCASDGTVEITADKGLVIEGPLDARSGAKVEGKLEVAPGKDS
jgi:hypothetical protein